MRRSTLTAFNLDEDSNPSPSNAKAAEESLTGLLHTVNMNTTYTIWRKEQDGQILAIWQNSSFSRVTIWLKGYGGNWIQ